MFTDLLLHKLSSYFTSYFIEPHAFGKGLEGSKVALAGEDLMFEAEVTSPAAECVWFKDNVRLESSVKHEVIADGLSRKLIVHNCKPEDKGCYTCAIGDETKTLCDLEIDGNYHFILLVAGDWLGGT